MRDSVYYQTKILEQQSESGGVRLIFEEKDLVGVFFYAREDILEILEPVILQEKRMHSWRRWKNCEEKRNW